MSVRPRDGAARLLAIATSGLAATRPEWAAAMRAELASIDDPGERRRFARSAARAALRQGVGLRIGFALLTGALVIAVTVVASRLQLGNEGAGVLGVTVFIPALLLVLVTMVASALARSFLGGLRTGVLALCVSFAALVAALAVEGSVWMDRRGVFLLDGDPPRGVVGTADVVLNVFTTGMWVGHVIFWVSAVVVGAVCGAWVGGRLDTLDVRSRTDGEPRT